MGKGTGRRDAEREQAAWDCWETQGITRGAEVTGRLHHDGKGTTSGSLPQGWHFVIKHKGWSDVFI